MQKPALLLLIGLAAIAAAGQVAAADRWQTDGEADAVIIPRMMRYQGRLTDSAGRALPDSIYSATFRLYREETGGTELWTEDRPLLLRSGLFSLSLGMVTPIPALPDDGLCYLEMQVNPGPALTPRIKLTSVPFAYLASKAETANVALSTEGSPWVRHADSVVYTARRLGIARGGAGNGLLGTYPETHLNLGIACTTGVASGSQMYGTALGYRNSAAGNGGASVVGGQYNRANGYAALVGGGYYNVAGGRAAVVSAGLADSALGEYSAVLGGWGNLAGEDPTDTGAVVAGGHANKVIAKYGFVGGGSENVAAGRWSTVGGGAGNRASNFYSTIGGGFSNHTNNYYASVLGGYGDTATGNSSSVLGGAQNVVTGNYSVIAGGTGNRLTGPYSFAFGEGIVNSMPYVAVFFSTNDTGYILINRSTNSNPAHILEVGTVRGNGNTAHLTTTGNWVSTAKRSDWDRSAPLDGDALLERIAGLDIGVREFKDNLGRCIAPDGDEFSTAVGLSPSDGAISGLDVASVALAAIKELDRKLTAQQVEIEALKAELAERGR